MDSTPLSASVMAAPKLPAPAGVFSMVLMPCGARIGEAAEVMALTFIF
jgi:hypothetical protein